MVLLFYSLFRYENLKIIIMAVMRGFLLKIGNDFKNNISVLIPAAGLGKRSGLNYPKSLYKVKNVPIIVRIIKK